MNDIDDAMLELIRVHNKYCLPGSFRRRSQVDARWPSNLSRSVQLDYFFNNYEPVDVKLESGFTPIKFVNLDSLEKAQIGYKWTNIDTNTKLNEGGDHASVVVLDDSGGGKPLVAKTNIENTPVFASYGVVAPFRISDSLADFLNALAKLIEIVYGEFNIFDVSDDDGLSSLFVARVEADISPLLGYKNFRGFFDYFYG